MNILFSSDWHLGYTLGGANPQPRLPDQRRNIARIADYCEQHAVDVLALAGDIFEAQERGAARAAAECMVETLAVPLARGMRIVAIAGNHDRDYFIDTANVWLNAGARADQVMFRTKPDLVTIEANGERVNFALLPFPTAARYDLRHDDSGGVAARNELLAKLFAEKAEELRKQAAEMRLPTVLLTHVTVTGTTVKAHRISPRDDVVIPRGAFPEFELTVAGHIHKPERIGSAHFYYVGVLDRMDVGEKDYDTRVLLADIGPQGVREITSLPLDPTPIVAVTAEDEDGIVAQARTIDRIDETLVKLILKAPRGTYLAPLLDKARQLFPRLYGNVEMVWTDDEDQETPAVEGLNPANVEDTVRRYFDEQQMPEEERDALMLLVHELRAKTLVEADA
jgi:exonuclease SbcD